MQNKTNSENRHLVFLIFKKEQENDQTNDWFDNVFGIKTKYHRLRRFLVLANGDDVMAKEKTPRLFNWASKHNRDTTNRKSFGKFKRQKNRKIEPKKPKQKNCVSYR